MILPDVDYCSWRVVFPWQVLSLSFTCLNAVLLSFVVETMLIQFSKRIIPYAAVDVFCPWEQMSLGFSYTTI